MMCTHVYIYFSFPGIQEQSKLVQKGATARAEANERERQLITHHTNLHRGQALEAVTKLETVPVVKLTDDLREIIFRAPREPVVGARPSGDDSSDSSDSSSSPPSSIDSADSETTKDKKISYWKKKADKAKKQKKKRKKKRRKQEKDKSHKKSKRQRLLN